MTTAIVAVHVVFIWVLGMTMTAKTVDNVDTNTKNEVIRDVEKETIE